MNPEHVAFISQHTETAFVKFKLSYFRHNLIKYLFLRGEQCVPSRKSTTGLWHCSAEEMFLCVDTLFVFSYLFYLLTRIVNQVLCTVICTAHAMFGIPQNHTALTGPLWFCLAFAQFLYRSAYKALLRLVSFKVQPSSFCLLLNENL